MTHYLIEGEPTVKDFAEEVKKSAEAGKEAYDRLKEAKEAVDKAKEFREKGLTAEERKRGDTLKEYRAALKDAYDRVMTAKRDLTSMTGTITRKQFQDVNNLIDSFNRSRNDSGQQAGGAAGPVLSQYPALAPVTPGELRGKLAPGDSDGRYTVFVYKRINGQWIKQEDRTLSTNEASQAEKYAGDVKRIPGWTATSNLPQGEPIVGTTWRPSYDNGETYAFLAGNVLRASRGGVSKDGRWEMTGTSVSMYISIMPGTVTHFRGSLSGGQLSGESWIEGDNDEHAGKKPLTFARVR